MSLHKWLEEEMLRRLNDDCVNRVRPLLLCTCIHSAVVFLGLNNDITTFHVELGHILFIFPPA